MASKRPNRVKIRAYQVGFGDCLLVTFYYGSGSAGMERHVLIDFGSTARPKSGAHTPLEIANHIAAETSGKLHAVVATHRHRDHISGFGGKSGKVIAGLNPSVVLQPWTEHPDADPKAKAAPKGLKGIRAFRAALNDMHALAAQAVKAADQYPKTSLLGRQLGFLGEANLKNLAAIKTLQALSGKHVYGSFGSSSGLEAVLPGVKVDVLGPPTLEQTTSIQTQRSKDPDEFWHLQALATTRATAARALFSSTWRARGGVPPEARWFVKRADKLSGEQMLEIVRILDDALNNTSLILLFQTGSKKLLFPGDAQIENWSYALKEAKGNAAIRKKLATVDLYKVGHHGSLNATPKSLWKLFTRKGAASKNNRLTTVLSTMAGKHGSSDRQTEVPRSKLLTELTASSNLRNTQTVTKKGDFYVAVELKL
jgi:hypothetical protein